MARRKSYLKEPSVQERAKRLRELINDTPLKTVVEQLLKTSGRRYDGPTISKLQGGTKALTPDDIDAFSRIDPEGRGRVWLAWGDDGAGERRTSEEGETGRFLELEPGAPVAKAPAAKVGRAGSASPAAERIPPPAPRSSPRKRGR